MNQPHRVEHDLLGDRKVPAEAYYGVHTLRAVENFPITGTPISIYPDLIRALAQIKLAAAKANEQLGLLVDAVDDIRPYFDTDILPIPLLGTARGLLLLNGIGTAAGPLVGGAAMSIVGPGGLFLYAAAVLATLAGLAVARRQPKRPIEARAARYPSTPMITGSLESMMGMQELSETPGSAARVADRGPIPPPLRSRPGR